MIGVGRWVPSKQVVKGEGRAMILVHEGYPRPRAFLTVIVGHNASTRAALTAEDLRALAGQALAAAMDLEAPR